jgi:hypothetical protein
MPRAKASAIRFVRALLGGGSAVRRDGQFCSGDNKRLDAADVAELVSAGVLQGTGEACSATAEARQWVRRQLLAEDEFAAQHRVEVSDAGGVVRNLNESPLSRLAAKGGDGVPYLLPHQVEAGERVRKLVDRAQMQPRMTMTYSHELRVGGKGAGGGGGDIGDMAADARKRLAEISRVLPADCAGVVLDVCGLMKGLQLVETERGWPRRSAKLVLRIGLDQLARHFGLASEAVGARGGRDRVWVGDGGRPTEIG